LYYPSLEEFSTLALNSKVVPVYREIIVDMETPISLYQKVCLGKDFTYLLESVEGGQHLARYSFIGYNPFLIFKAKGSETKLIRKDKTEVVTGNPLALLEGIMASYHSLSLPQLPRFSGGGVGYFSYDTIRYLEELPEENLDDLSVPDLFFLFAKNVLIFDHVQHSVKIMVNVLIEDEPREAPYQKAVDEIEQIIEQIRKTAILPAYSSTGKHVQHPVKSNFTRPEYEKSIRKIQEYIKAGDVFQVGFSQRFQVEIDVEPLEIYRSLRVVNPSPYMYYLNYGDLQVIGTSPELLLRVEDGTAVTRPIAGTRPRGATKQEDLALAENLLQDEKERAEHVMLVDLHRNDLGRVCKYGTVEVDEFMVIERYSHVMHMVSNVRGQLAEEYDALAAFEASFPAGTVSGAPKIRAMEIIEELEPNRRGIYAGAVGYWSFNGNLDTCITIRTIVIKGKQAYVQAGGGIVADSKPELEYEETVNKAKALLQAINLAHGGEKNVQKASS